MTTQLTEGSILECPSHKDENRLSYVSDISSPDDDGDDEFDLNTRFDLSSKRALCCGRSKEMAVLREAFEGVKGPSAGSAVMLVSGCSGSGKSRLIESMRDEVFEQGGYFVMGKYDQVRRQEPFPALVAAFTDICDLIIQAPEDRKEEIKNKLGEAARILAKLIDNLKYITGNDPYDDTPMSTAFYRFQLVCRSFLRAVSCPHHPIVLVLDDLQFADPGSMEAFRVLASDTESQNVLIIGAFRDNELKVEQVQPTGPTYLPTNVLNVTNLDLDGVNEMIAALTEQDSEATVPLSEMILHKTGGNAYFISQFLETLQDKGLLYFDEPTQEYCWDLERIRTQTNISENVLGVVRERIARLPGNQSAILTIAAYIGFHFDTKTLKLVIQMTDFANDKRRSFRNHSASVQNLKKNLAASQQPQDHGRLLTKTLMTAKKQGFLEDGTNPSSYMFSHDRVQQLFYESIGSKKEQDLLHLRIGRVLWRQIEQQTVGGSSSAGASQLFEVSDHMNRAIEHVTAEKEIVKLAKLDIEAGKLALSRAAYDSARQYFQYARDLLEAENEHKTKSGKIRWKHSSDYAIMLDLMNSLARVELYLGNFEECEKLIAVVKQNGKEFTDKVTAYQIKVDSLGTQERLEEAVKFGLKTIRKLGTTFPRDKNLPRLSYYLRKTKSLLNDMTDDGIATLSAMTDPARLATMQFLGSVATYSYLMQSKSEQFSLIVLKMVRLTVRYGLSPVSPLGFAYFGLLNGILGEYGEAGRYGRLALRLGKEMNTVRGIRARTLCIAYNFTFHWKEPLSNCIVGLETCWKNGLAQGDVLWASLGVSGLVLANFILGAKDLNSLKEQCQSYCLTMEQFHLSVAARLLLPCWQTIANLCGDNDDPTILTGEAMNEDRLTALVQKDRSNVAYATIVGLKLQLLFMFEEWRAASKLLADVIQSLQYIEANFLVMYFDFFIGLTCAELYRQKRKGIYLRYGRKSLHKMNKWAEHGVPCCRPLLLLLKAEYTSITCKNWADIASAYTDAIEAGGESNHNLRAIAYECAGNRCSEMTDEDDDRADALWGRAIEEYAEWGCFSKVDLLQRQLSINM